MNIDENLWRDGTDPLALLAVLFPQRSHGSGSPQSRTCRLYLAGCARRHWANLPPVARALVTAAEALAELGEAGEDLRLALAPAAECLIGAGDPARNCARAAAALERVRAGLPPDLVAVLDPTPTAGPELDPEWPSLATLVYMPFEEVVPPFVWVPRALHSAALVRDIYYHPSGLPPFLPGWRTSTVVALARRMYDEREFSPMPILADALQDAGCDSESILTHCRTHPEHARGCWVLDRVLGRR